MPDGRLKAAAAGLAWAMLGSGAALSAEVVALGSDAATGDPVAQCRDLAASPFELGAPGTAFDDDQIFLDGALAACEAARAAVPDSLDAETWLGRVYVLVGRAAEAAPLLEDAAGQGNAFAAHLMSRLLSNDVFDGVDDDPDRALQLLRQSADFGFAPAAFDLGLRYEAGNGVETDYAEARRLYELASGQGYGMATYKLGLLHHAGYGVDADYTRAMSLYEQAAAQGEPAGSYGVGQLYQYGQGVEQDYGKAAENYQKGADAGEKMSQTALAYLYEQGLGVTQDFDKSFALLEDAAGQNYGFAQAALAIHYLFGEGTAVDADRAYDLAWAAQGNGVLYAEGIIGYMYSEGLGTNRDLSSALFHFQAGAEGGDQYSADRLVVTEIEIACEDAAGSTFEPGGVGHGVEFDMLDAPSAIEACRAALEANPGSVGDGVWLARAYLKAGDVESALPLLAPAVDAGNVLALSLYAELLVSGPGVEADVASGLELYERAAADNFAPALYALGRLYAEGGVVARDVSRAIGYFERAYDIGYESAATELAALRGADETTVNADLAVGFGEEGPAY